MKILLSIFGMLHLTAQHVGGHIGLLRMIEHLTIIILDHFKPSTLSHVQTRLIHKIYQTLVLHVDDTSDPIEIMPPIIVEKYHCPQL